jgi:hypothetical protein
VLAYLARYTHHVAIANSRLIALDERGVTFRYKGRLDNAGYAERHLDRHRLAELTEAVGPL